ncbi:MAG: delta-aminolevulinic acid dehydratase [Blastocatellia bacterium]|nr:delta-aminolevulinic acid dehydratase [Blastocatellia bacterium]
MYEEVFEKLLNYCRDEQWQGYDPYDALNSSLFNYFPNSKYLRIAWTQFIKRSPFNIRPLVGIEKGENPKGLSLFVRALLLAYKKTKNEQYKKDAEELLERLWTMRSPGFDGLMCWGYNFAWQSRAFFAPIYTPSIVCTTFVAHAWLDHFEMFEEEASLEVAISACEFILEYLNYSEKDGEICFSYTPRDKSEVHNANLLGAELLARTASFVTDEEKLREMAIKSARFTVNRQAADGSWPYGTAPFQAWCDNFHTGFNLVSLDTVIRECGMDRWKEALEKGFKFYMSNFFLADGTPKYYHNKIYPIDIHSSAQAIVTFVRLKHLIDDSQGWVIKLTDWVLANMWDRSGYFYFQKTAFFTKKISYMRWSQAWMAYALAMANYAD